MCVCGGGWFAVAVVLMGGCGRRASWCGGGSMEVVVGRGCVWSCWRVVLLWQVVAGHCRVCVACV